MYAILAAFNAFERFFFGEVSGGLNFTISCARRVCAGSRFYKNLEIVRDVPRFPGKRWGSVSVFDNGFQIFSVSFGGRLRHRERSRIASLCDEYRRTIPLLTRHSCVRRRSGKYS